MFNQETNQEMVGTVELDKLKTETRLTQVEVDTKLIRSDITTIKNNHLKHIEKSMDMRYMKWKMWNIIKTTTTSLNFHNLKLF